MTDGPVVHIGENSPEKVAYELLINIAHNEMKSLRARDGNKATADRKWLLDTYAECIEAVRGYRDWKPRPHVDIADMEDNL